MMQSSVFFPLISAAEIENKPSNRQRLKPQVSYVQPSLQTGVKDSSLVWNILAAHLSNPEENKQKKTLCLLPSFVVHTIILDKSSVGTINRSLSLCGVFFMCVWLHLWHGGLTERSKSLTLLLCVAGCNFPIIVVEQNSPGVWNGRPLSLWQCFSDPRTLQ